MMPALEAGPPDPPEDPAEAGPKPDPENASHSNQGNLPSINLPKEEEDPECVVTWYFNDKKDSHEQCFLLEYRYEVNKTL